MQKIAYLLGYTITCHLSALDISEPVIVSDQAPAVNEVFGSATAISDQYYAIVNTGKHGSVDHAGVISVYDLATHQTLQQFTVPMPQENELDGASLAISGDYLVAGIPESNQEKGQAIVWNIGSGEIDHIYTHPDPQDGDRFGHSVTVHGDRVLIGVPKDEPSTTNDPATDSGSAYLFDLSTQQFLKSFSKDGNPRDDAFGSSVSLTSENVIIGCPNHDIPEGEGNEGAVFVYDQSSYALERVIIVQNSDAMASLGFNVVAQEDILLVSAYRGFSTQNACYIFDLSSGNQIQKLTPRTSETSTFGYKIAIGNTLAVGDHFANRTGRVYLYEHEGSFLKEISVEEGQNGDQFSSGLSFHGQHLIAGAKGVDGVGENRVLNSGAAYLYEVTQQIPLFIEIEQENINLTWDSVAGSTYQVMTSTTLEKESWTVLNSTEIVADGAASSYSINFNEAGSKAFFKVIAL